MARFEVTGSLAPDKYVMTNTLGPRFHVAPGSSPTRKITWSHRFEGATEVEDAKARTLPKKRSLWAMHPERMLLPPPTRQAAL
jgi:hypothetical protein